MRFWKWEIRRYRNHKVTAIHPEYKQYVEFAFQIEGRDFYMYKDILNMFPLRLNRCRQFINEAEMRITSKDHLKLIEELKTKIDAGKLGDAYVLANTLEMLSNQFIETDTYYRLFSCLFFDLEEDLTDYDYEYNQDKIDLFKKQPKTAFFLTKPMSDYLPQSNISEEDFTVFLEQQTRARQYLQKIKSNYTISD